jgi:hypothetical protein
MHDTYNVKLRRSVFSVRYKEIVTIYLK